MKQRPNFEAIPEKYHIYIILLYSLTAALAFLSNAAALVVLNMDKALSKNLSKYLIHLSVSDLILSIFSIPFTYMTFMFGHWYLPPALCPLVPAIQFGSVFVSVFILVAIGVNRYAAIVNPLQSRANKNMVNGTLVIIWIAGFLLACNQYNLSKAIEVKVSNKTTVFICRETLSQEKLGYHVIFTFVVTFLVPVAVLIYVYISIATVIFQRNLDNSARSMLRQQKKKMFKLLVCIVVTFIICWTPIHFMNVITTLWPKTRRFSTEAELHQYVLTYFALHWIAMAHSTANPIIYTFMSKTFRVSHFLFLFFQNSLLSKQTQT